MSNTEPVDPLEYLVKLNAKSASIDVVERQRSSNRMPDAAGKQKHISSNPELVGAEYAGMIKGLKHGPRHVAYYRMTYSHQALRQLECSLADEAATIATNNHWRVRNGRPVIRLAGVLALLEKYFNVCKICEGSTFKKDRKRCKSCVDGFRKRSQKECGDILGMDPKNYTRIWENRVEKLIDVLEGWEEQARTMISLNVRGYE